MSLNINNVTLAGNLTRFPEVRRIGDDRVVANFGLAINRRWRNADGELVEDATFIEVEAWGRTGELVGQYLTKGSPVYLEGRLKLDEWEDKEGQKRQRIKVVAEHVQFVGKRPADSATSEASAGAGPVAPAPTARRQSVPRAVAAKSGEQPPF